MKRIGIILILVAGLFVGTRGFAPAKAADAPQQTADASKLDYAKDILPIFQANCAKCHLDGAHKGGMDLSSRDNLLKGGDSETPAVVPHDPGKSKLIELLTADDPEDMMPKKGKRLPADQIALVKRWINSGGAWGNLVSSTTKPSYVAPLEPKHPALPAAVAGSNLTNPIDLMLQPYFAQHKVAMTQSVDDRIYARRVYLDVVGMLPTAQETDAFIADTTTNKRENLVNKLLADNRRYAEHWMSFWNDCLRNDYQGTGYIDGGRRQITSWLYNALYHNMPYDQFVASLLNPTPDNEGFINGIIWRGAVSASQGKEVQAAQNITQVFLGLNFKCNSCHDSFISDWKLADSYGLAGVFADKPMEMYRCEKPTGTIAPVKFIYPQLGSIDGNAPRAQRLKQLATLMTSKQDGRLTRTIVNRLWARFLGQGIVEPVDEMDQQPWDADLLDWLASDLSDHGFDLKRTIAMILTSQAYQMPAVGAHERIEAGYVFEGPVVRRMSAEQFCDAVSQVTDVWHGAPVSGEAMSLPQFTLPAHWVWTETAAKVNAPLEEIYLRKTFDLPDAPSEAIVAADADNEYDLYVNGKQVLAGRDFTKPDVVDLKPYLIKGTNVFAVAARNGMPPGVPVGTKIGPNPAGFWLLASIKLPSGQSMDVGTGTNWLSSHTKRDGWDQASFDPAGWQAAADLGEASTPPWNLLGMLSGSKQKFTFRFDRVRAVWVNNDMLMTALGRPNRERVVTNRFSPATMLQMLELTNGRTLSKLNEDGAQHWLSRHIGDSKAIVTQIYRESLGRSPTDQELAMSVNLVGSAARQQGVEDLLWSIMMLPEFQLVY